MIGQKSMRMWEGGNKDVCLTWFFDRILVDEQILSMKHCEKMRAF